jgi:hypothetical protein
MGLCWTWHGDDERLEAKSNDDIYRIQSPAFNGAYCFRLPDRSDGEREWLVQLNGNGPTIILYSLQEAMAWCEAPPERRDKIKRDAEMYRLERKFGKFWAFHFLKEPFKDGQGCYCCDDEATQRIEANIWGTIYQYDTCQACAKKWDGVRTDGVPPKSQANKASPESVDARG